MSVGTEKKKKKRRKRERERTQSTVAKNTENNDDCGYPQWEKKRANLLFRSRTLNFFIVRVTVTYTNPGNPAVCTSV